MKTILIIDDKRENLDLAQEQLGAFCKLIFASTFSYARKILDQYSRNQIGEIDGVFTDIMMPGEDEGINKDNLEIGKEVPYGLIISIRAKNLGIENVVLVTDLNHHSGPIAWALDVLKEQRNFVNCIQTKNWLKAYTLCFGEPSEEVNKSVESLDLLVIGYDSDNLYYELLIKDFPDFKSSYLDTEDVYLVTKFILHNKELIINITYTLMRQ
jgi:CheY-like chemotaxis protein